VVPRCPSCQQPIAKDKIVNDKNLQKEIQNLEVYCTNKDKGCDWDGTLREFQVHMETCGFIVIDCPNECGAKFERRFMTKHQNEDCAKRTIICEFCMKISK
jgi:TNF receptor-associated factor 4